MNGASVTFLFPNPLINLVLSQLMPLFCKRSFVLYNEWRLATLSLCPSFQSTCSWVWWWCTSCCVLFTRWPTCTAWPPSCSCHAARNPTWTRTGSPLWTTNMKTRHALTWLKKLPASLWSRDHNPRTTPSTKAELERTWNSMNLWRSLGLEPVIKHTHIFFNH